jgi:hypothetical protein
VDAFHPPGVTGVWSALRLDQGSCIFQDVDPRNHKVPNHELRPYNINPTAAEKRGGEELEFCELLIADFN